MVREGEEDEKKSGWFSRKKNRSSLQSSRVSRPPSYSSLSPKKDTGRSSLSGNGDDDLPPREDALSSPPGLHRAAVDVPLPSTPATEFTPIGAAGEVEGDVSSALPVTSGFNLTAIKEVIGKDSADFPMPPRNRFPTTRIHEPTQRSESVPLPSPVPSPPASGIPPTVRASFDERQVESRPVAGPSSYDRHEPHQRSRSYESVLGSEGDDTSAQMSGFTLQGADELDEYTSATATRRSFWPSEATEVTPTFGDFGGYRSTLGQDASLSSNTPFGTASSLAPTSFDSFGSSSSFTRNPFTSPSANSLLSFGGTDGSITQSPSLSDAERDPWNISALSDARKKGASTLDLNPWQS